MDATGELNWFRAVPDLQRQAEPTGDRPSWNEWFPAQYTGYDLNKLAKSEIGNTPPGSFDASQSWQAVAPTGEKVSITAAAFRGEPVFFEVVPAGQPSLGREFRFADQPGLFLFIAAMTLATLLAVFLVVKNVIGGRWDRRGAWRLLIFFVIVGTVGNLAAAHHVGSLWENAVVSICFASAVVWAVRIWLFYVSFEPHVRRRWPRLLISWSRLLEGRFTDPVLGTEILFGACIGAYYAVLADLPYCFRSVTYPGVMSPGSLANYFVFLGEIRSILFWATFTNLMAATLIVVCRAIFRSELVAAGIFVVFMSFFHQSTYVLPTWTLLVFLFANSLMVFALVRYGLVTATAAAIVADLLRVPISMNPGDFWFGHGLFAIVLVLSIASFGMFTATGGRLWPWLRTGHS
jgi:serine/threonine-protein kinase